MSIPLRNLTVRSTGLLSTVSRSRTSISTRISPSSVYIAPPIHHVGGIYMQSVRTMSLGKLSGKERKRLRQQRDGKNIYIPSYVNVRDLSHRLGLTVLQLHKAGSTFFSWWPRASEKQLKKDGYSMLHDLVLRFDECAVLCHRLGFTAIYEHTGLERIRNEHYNLASHLASLGRAGQAITPQLRQKLGPLRIGHGTGPRPIPDADRPKHIQPKQPVVCIVGHVDHGKTTLLDRLRGTHVASREDAGITQDLYSYQADLGEHVLTDWNTLPEYGIDSIPKQPPSSSIDKLEEYDTDTLLHTYKTVTFLDTPGHASFFDMRENGVLFCDAVVLIVSAVDGVCPQTLESIEYIKTFKTPVIVALSKCDLPEANPKKVIKQLRDAGLLVLPHDDPDSMKQLLAPEIGKKSFFRHQIAPYVCISALHDINIDVLKKTMMRAFLTIKPQCDILAPPVGLVLEAMNEEGGRGRVLRVLLSSGTVSQSDAFISGIFAGRVKDIRAYGEVHTDEFRIKPSHLTAFPNNNRTEDHVFDISDHVLESKEDQRRRERSYAQASRKPKLGSRLQVAVPGVAVEIVGCEGLPQAGDDFRVIPSELLAKTIAETRRFEMEYPEQGRFNLGGLTPTTWTPPPLTFLEEQKSMNLISTLDVDAISNLAVGDTSGVVPDIHSDVDVDVDAEEDAEMTMLEDIYEDEEAMEEINKRYMYKPYVAPKSTAYEDYFDEEMDANTKYDEDVPDWDTIHADAPSYERPFVLKAGKAGYLRMITDSIKAFNETFPEKQVTIVHSSVGTLNIKDIEKAASAGTEDGSVECPILLFRTRTPNARILKEVKKYPTTVYEYAVFDDMIKHMIGEEYFNRMFENSQHLRLQAPGSSFVEDPTSTPETTESMKLKSLHGSTTGVEKARKIRSTLTGKTREIAQPITSTLLPPISIATEDYDPVKEKAAAIVAAKIQELKKPTRFVKRPLRLGGLGISPTREKTEKEIEEALKVLRDEK